MGDLGISDPCRSNDAPDHPRNRDLIWKQITIEINRRAEHQEQHQPTVIHDPQRDTRGIGADFRGVEATADGLGIGHGQHQRDGCQRHDYGPQAARRRRTRRQVDRDPLPVDEPFQYPRRDRANNRCGYSTDDPRHIQFPAENYSEEREMEQMSF
jgi:hypothetical protein